MTDRNPDGDEGRGALRHRVRQLDAPASLRDRVHESLRARDLIRTRRSTAGWRVGLIAAAAVLCFAGGVFAGRISTRQGAEAATPRYALLLYGGSEADSGAALSRAEEYGRWAAGLSGDARFVSGEELGRVVDELPAPSRREPVAGFFLIDAPSDEIARRIARDCPHLKYGGRIVVQAIGSGARL